MTGDCGPSDRCAKAGVDEDLVRQAARRIATAGSVASVEDLGVQMNRHSTLVSCLHKLLVLLTGQFGKKGAAYRPSSFVPLFGSTSGGVAGLKRTPVTGAPIICGLMPCNSIPDEILSDHGQRFRGLIVESGNPAHSLADGPRMRQALAALDLLVVIDLAMTEAARLAHYVLPVAGQFEKAEATFFNFEFPHNYFHVRRALMPPLEGLFSEAELHSRLVEALGALPDAAVATLRVAWQAGRAEFRHAFMALMRGDPKLAGIAAVLLYRAIGPLLPEGIAEAAAVWGLCQTAAPKQAASMARAGFGGPAPEAADARFDALVAGPSAVVFSIDDWAESFQRVATANGRIQLAIPELFDELDALATEPAPAGSVEFPLVLSAGERRSFTANTIIRNPAWRNKDRHGALRMHPDDAARAGVADGGAALLSTRRGAAKVLVELSERMRPGHVALPNGLGLDYAADQRHRGGHTELQREAPRLCRGGSRSLTFPGLVHRRDCQP